MALVLETTPQHPARQIFEVGDAQTQMDNFSDVYHSIFDFIEDGGLAAQGYNGADIARWRRNIRPGVVWIGGKPSEIEFFRMMMGGTPKETDGTDLTIQYNSAIDFNIYAAADATGTTGTVTGGCYYGSVVNGNYTGPHVAFQLSTNSYSNAGQNLNVNVGDSLLIQNDMKWVTVFKIDTTTPYAFTIYAYPMDQNYTAQIYGGWPILPNHVQMTFGYADEFTRVNHSEWETPGYLKVIQPWMLTTDWETLKNLDTGYKDVIQFPIIFDMVNGGVINSWDFKAMADGRERMIMSENMLFFAGEVLTNTEVQGAAFSPNQYGGFEGFITTIFYGGGQIQQYDNAYGFDYDVDYTSIILQNDAQKLSTEYLMLCGLPFVMSSERRAQDAFKNNSGACTFETFQRMGDESADIKRLGIDSWHWLGHTLHRKVVGAWSDKRWVGNAYIKNLGILMPTMGLTDSNGQEVSPVEYYIPKGQREGHQWKEIWRDHELLSDKATKWSGTISHTIMMSVNAVENMWGIVPTYIQ